MAWQKYLLIPKLVWYSVRAPRHQGTAWTRYWEQISRTGPTGDVLWDAGSPTELAQSLTHLHQHMDLTLPVVDLGCGNGRHSRALAPHFPQVIGLDIAAPAIARARHETQGLDNVMYRVLDATQPGVGAHLADEFGDVNVYVRGVLHVLDRQQRGTLVQNLHALVG